MFRFNKDESTLEVSKIRLPEPSTVYEVAETWKSYEWYRKVGLRRDIEEVLLPLLNKAIRGGKEGVDRIYLDEYKCVYDNTANYMGHEYNSAFVKFKGLSIPDNAKPFCVFKLPYMDEYGLVKREGKQYALISELVQDDDITFNKGEMKIVTKLGCFINLKESASGPMMMYRKKKQSAMNLLFALANEEGLDPHGLYDKLRSTSLCNLYRDEQSREVAMCYGAAEMQTSDFFKALKQPAYALDVVRDKINKVVSLDRALGKVLSRKVVLKSGEIIPGETLVTAQVIRKLKANRVNEVYVRNIPNMTGYYLARPLEFPVLRKGTEIVEAIRGLHPDLKGKYLAKDLFIEDAPIVVPEDTPITKELMEMFSYNGALTVMLKQSVTSEKMVEVPLEYAIIGNRHFRKSELGSTADGTEYVYVNEDGIEEPAKTTLCAYDLLALIALFDNLNRGIDLNVIANLDLGLRKKVDLAAESFHKAFEKAAPDFVRMIKQKFVATYEGKPGDFGVPDTMEAMFFKLSDIWWNKLYVKMKLIKQIDMENPVSFYSSFSKINAIVKDKNAITKEQHSISMGHYGRLCPYETPAGKTMGVVSNKATGCMIENGVMKTSYYEVRHMGNDKSFIVFNKVWLTVEEEEKYRIGDITSLDFDEKTGEIKSTERVLARIPNTYGLEKMTVSYVDVKYLDYVNTDPSQSDGTTATTIPFQGANDSARVVFGLSMCKQAKGLLNPEVPIVITEAFKTIPRISPYYMVQAEYDGEVIEARPGSVTMFYPSINEHKTYEFKMKQFEGKSVVIRALCCQEGDRVKAGDILVTSNFIKDGYMATGTNCLVGYMNKGANYEDGVFGCKRLSAKLTSYGAYMETEPIPKAFKRNKVEPTNRFKYNQPDSVIYTLKHAAGTDKTLRSVRSKKLKGFLIDAAIGLDKYSNRVSAVTASSVAMDMLHEGDKLANRHGNKGVTPKLQDNELMPRFKNGEFLDIAYNPCGVSSRMNIGQILECNAGLAGYILGIRVRSDSFNGATVEEIKLLLSYTWHLANCDDPEKVFNDPRFAELPKELHEHCRGRMHLIQNWKDSFNEDGTAYMYNPKTGKMFETPMTVGVNYVYKLIHEVHKKEHARGGLCTSPYVEKLSCPTKGSSNDGGQRKGYMEIDAYLAYGCANYVHELLNERGDNPVARNNMTVGALHKGKKYMLDESTGIRRSTEYFVNILEALGIHVDFEGALPNNTKEECERRVTYRVNELLMAKDTYAPDEGGEATLSLSDFSKQLGSL